MTDQVKVYIASLCILLTAAGFLAIEWTLFRFVSRSATDVEVAPVDRWRSRRVMAYGSMIALSLLSFPLATLSVVESFVAPWQIMWPSAALFVADGVAGLTLAAWAMTTTGRRVVGIGITTTVSVILALLAMSIFLVRWR